jgi:hypothetical protein
LGRIGSSLFPLIGMSHRTGFVRRDNMVAKPWLDPIALERAGGFERAELSRLERWHEFFAD